MNNSLRHIQNMGRFTGLVLAGSMLLASMCIPSSTLKPHAAASRELAPGDSPAATIHCTVDALEDIADGVVYMPSRSDGPTLGPILPSELNRLARNFEAKSDIAESFDAVDCGDEVCVTPVRVNHRSD